MNPFLRDLVDHQFWADTELWNAIGAHGPARDDKAIRDRLHHIHQVQRFFMRAVGDRAVQPALTRPDDFPGFGELRDYAREAHDAVRRSLASLTDARLAQAVAIPWIKDPPLSITVAEAIMQMTLHSHYHRGRTRRGCANWVEPRPSPISLSGYGKGNRRQSEFSVLTGCEKIVSLSVM